jgi:hypothetical protein
MTDTEFDILDELYFLKSFAELNRVLKIPEIVLKEELENLYQKGWLKCYESAIKEPISGEPDFQANYQKYYYLATKAGLLAHNTQ